MVPTPEQLALFETLTQLPGVPGQEKAVRDFLKKELAKYADDVLFDNLGGVFALKKPRADKAPKLLMCGHLDEVGFLVKTITDNGLLKIHPVGGWWSQTLLAQRVTVYSGRTGLGYKGTIASIPPHLLTEELKAKPVAIEDMLVDIGALDREEVLGSGIRPGDMVVVDGPFTPLFEGRKLLAKAWDNRFGCALAVEVLKELQGSELGVELYIGATVQEEVGLRGARVAATMIQPDLAVVFESSPADDYRGVAEGFGRQGQGALVRFVDRSSVTHRGLFKYIVGLCESKGIPFQYFMALGGTDAGEIHLVHSGVPAIAIGVASRYIHTSGSLMDFRDYCAAKDLALAVCRDLDGRGLAEILSYSR